MSTQTITTITNTTVVSYRRGARFYHSFVLEFPHRWIIVSTFFTS